MMTLKTRVEELGRERESIEVKVKALDERRTASAEKAKELSAAVKAMQQQASKLAATMKSERERRVAAEERYGEVVGLLRSSKAEHRETEREKRSAEALDNLQRLFPGVHGRMTDICKISQKSTTRRSRTRWASRSRRLSPTARRRPSTASTTSRRRSARSRPSCRSTRSAASPCARRTATWAGRSCRCST